MVNFNEGKELPNRFSGSEKKKTIIMGDRRYLVKFPDPARESKAETSYINNVYSEYIGCQIFKSIGIPTQETLLGKYTMPDGREKVVCGCEDFNSAEYQLLEFNNLTISNIDVENVDTNDPDIIERYIRLNESIEDAEEAIDRFWDMFVIDAFIANTDRHNANWGFMENMETHKLSVAPVYDCGSSLFPLVPDSEITELLQSPTELKNTFLNVYSCLKYEKKKINYYSFFRENMNEQCSQALMRVFPRIDMEEIRKIIEGISDIYPDRKEFYQKALEFRYENILLPVYKKVRREG